MGSVFLGWFKLFNNNYNFCLNDPIEEAHFFIIDQKDFFIFYLEPIQLLMQHKLSNAFLNFYKWGMSNDPLEIYH